MSNVTNVKKFSFVFLMNLSLCLTRINWYILKLKTLFKTILNFYFWIESLLDKLKNNKQTIFNNNFIKYNIKFTNLYKKFWFLLYLLN
jgi:hypothetical protein